jgi:signal transduction histidine kinase
MSGQNLQYYLLSENMKTNDTLNIYSNLSSLDLFNTKIDSNETAKDAMRLLRENTLTPGILIFNEYKYQGMLSRRQLFESMSRPFSLEIFSNKPISFLYENIEKSRELVFSYETTISNATHSALERGEDLMFEPVVVKLGPDKLALLDIPQLLLAQSKIHLMTMNSLRIADEFKTEILAIAAHDLKNPLNTIMGLSDLIKTESKDITSIFELADLIFRSSHNMYDLIQKLLSSTAIESNRILLELSEVDIKAIITASIEHYELIAKEKSQNIRFKYNSNEIGTLQLDEMKITEIIDNLINNAIKYSDYGKEIEVGLYSTSNSIVCYIKDEGPGITDEDQSKLFGKFQKLSAIPTGGEPSSGLGLYIVKKFVEMHQGHIWVESKFGKGSKFIFELPYNVGIEKEILITKATCF